MIQRFHFTQIRLFLQIYFTFFVRLINLFRIKSFLFTYCKRFVQTSSTAMAQVLLPYGGMFLPEQWSGSGFGSPEVYLSIFTELIFSFSDDEFDSNLSNLISGKAILFYLCIHSEISLWVTSELNPESWRNCLFSSPIRSVVQYCYCCIPWAVIPAMSLVPGSTPASSCFFQLLFYPSPIFFCPSSGSCCEKYPAVSFRLVLLIQKAGFRTAAIFQVIVPSIFLFLCSYFSVLWNSWLFARSCQQKILPDGRTV